MSDVTCVLTFKLLGHYMLDIGKAAVTVYFKQWQVTTFWLQNGTNILAKYIVTLDMKGCICYFTNWQIHSFISKWRYYSSLSLINNKSEVGFFVILLYWRIAQHTTLGIEKKLLLSHYYYSAWNMSENWTNKDVLYCSFHSIMFSTAKLKDKLDGIMHKSANPD